MTAAIPAPLHVRPDVPGMPGETRHIWTGTDLDDPSISYLWEVYVDQDGEVVARHLSVQGPSSPTWHLIAKDFQPAPGTEATDGRVPDEAP